MGWIKVTHDTMPKNMWLVMATVADPLGKVTVPVCRWH